VEGTILLMESNFDKVLNIGSERLVSINQLADIIIGISGKTIKKKYVLSAPQGVRGRNADLTLTRKILGWEPKISLEEGLNKTYSWVSAQVINNE
jgi:GDP-D-mannose 3', 5'-epimerase